MCSGLLDTGRVSILVECKCKWLLYSLLELVAYRYLCVGRDANFILYLVRKGLELSPTKI